MFVVLTGRVREYRRVIRVLRMALNGHTYMRVSNHPSKVVESLLNDKGVKSRSRVVECALGEV